MFSTLYGYSECDPSSEIKMPSSKFPNQETICKTGPAGCTKGKHWEFRGRTEIVQIFISFGKYIHSICFQYVENGSLVMSPVFGSSDFNGPGFQAVKLDYPSETITGITVQCGSYYVEKLSIHTNKGIYGPYGKYRDECLPKYREFETKFGPHNDFAGFHGTYDSQSLKSIGVYFKPATTLGHNCRKLEHGDGDGSGNNHDNGLSAGDQIDESMD